MMSRLKAKIFYGNVRPVDIHQFELRVYYHFFISSLNHNHYYPRLMSPVSIVLLVSCIMCLLVVHITSLYCLCVQVTTVAQYRMDRAQPTVERTFRIIGRIGQSLNLAIERFATVCEMLADDSPHFKKDMFDNCKEARAEGT